MAVVQLVLAVVGALLVVGGALAWRHGVVRGGGLRVRRGEPLFVPLVGLLVVGGLGLAAAAAWIATLEPAPRRVERGVGYELAVPDGFRPLPDVEAELPPGGRALGDGRSELSVVETESAAGTGTVGELLRRRGEAVVLGDQPATARELATALELRWSYPSPRGWVVARALGYVERGGRMGWVTATCAHAGEASLGESDCEQALAGLRLTAADRLPLSAEVR